MEPMPRPDRCPACGYPLPAYGPVLAVCPRCALPLTGELAAELREIDAALARLGAEYARLLGRRTLLLSARHPAPLPSGRGPGPHPAAWGRAPYPGRSGGPTRSGPRREPERDASAPTARNLLLAFGGVLLAFAAVAFTVVSWGELGIGGRAAVLGTLTVAALAVPVALLRRRLPVTAEVVACLGLVLLLLDGYALRRFAFDGADAVRYAAAVLAVAGAAWAAYGRLTGGRLLLPAPTALLISQLPAALLALSYGSARGFALVMTVTAAGDAWAALPGRGRSDRVAVRTSAAVAGTVAGLCASATAVALSVTASRLALAGQAGALLLTLAVVGLLTARSAAAPAAARRAATTAETRPRPETPRPVGGSPTAPPVAATPAQVPPAPQTAPATDMPRGPGGRPWSGTVRSPYSAVAVLLSAVSALAVVAALGGVVRAATDGWAVPGYLVFAGALLPVAAALRRSLPAECAGGAAAGSAAVHGMAALWALPALVVSVAGPLAWAGSVWTGASRGAREATAPHLHGGVPFSVALVAALLTCVAAAAAWAPVAGVPRAVRAAAPHLALVTGTLLLAAAPTAADMPYAPAVALRTALAVALLATTVTGGMAAATVRTAFALGTAIAVTAAGWALAERTATFAVLGVLLVSFAVPALRPGPGPGARRAVGGVAAVCTAAGLAWAAAAAAGWAPASAAYPLVSVALGSLLLTRRTAPAVEWAGWVVAAAAVGQAAGDRPTLALVLALCGLLAAGAALRPDRRRAGYAASGLLVAASWVRLDAWGVLDPEAYTLPVSAVLLATGWLRRRRDPTASSWTAYGTALSATLLPSLAAAWSDVHGLRPLLLAAAALAVTLLGARHGLRAPLLLGGGTLVLDGLHELMPYLVQVLNTVPRWLPLALAGALLLGVGATYEQRLRDVRRVRDVLGRMR